MVFIKYRIAGNFKGENFRDLVERFLRRKISHIARWCRCQMMPRPPLLRRKLSRIATNLKIHESFFPRKFPAIQYAILTHASVCTDTHMYTHNTCTLYMHIYTHTHMHMYTHTHMHIYTHAHTPTNIYVCICIYIHMHEQPMNGACKKRHTNTHTCTFSLLLVAMVPVDVLINTQADTTSS